MNDSKMIRALSRDDEVPERFHAAMRQTLVRLQQEDAASPRARPALRRAAVALLAAVLLAAGTLSALAASDNEQAYALLYHFWPAAAQRLKPVHLASADQGLRLEVISAAVHGDEAEIYVSFQDLTGDRLDGSVDFFDTESINLPCDGWGTCTQVGYDAKSRTAYFLISTGSNDGSPIAGEKVTFSVGGFLSGKRETTATLASGAQLAALAECSAPVPLEDAAHPNDEGHIAAILPADAEAAFAPVEGMRVEAIGLIDGRLHVRLRGLDNRRTDNHGFLYLIDEGGERVFPENSAVLPSSGADQLTELEFGVPAADLGGYELRGDFVTASPLTEGRWQVTFPVISSAD